MGGSYPGEAMEHVKQRHQGALYPPAWRRQGANLAAARQWPSTLERTKCQTMDGAERRRHKEKQPGEG